MSNHPYFHVQPQQSALSKADTDLLDRYVAYLQRRGHTASTTKDYCKAVLVIFSMIVALQRRVR
ncbi:hypothetical protein SAMN05443545_101372 [Aidingimonas halophila]|uniref:Phage integrase, N-terminal SAM-like domain n=1 Tax=Aidingimonas halophila TaxID=574349 RepID=A0A1H2RNT7_9GAMM|nr:hypothetical protein SAMN05443545_101372 [Aidingimonas halophila]